MQKQIELKIPTSYEDITLRKWLELQNDLKNYEEDEEATTAVLLLHLCGLSPEYLTGISVDDYNLLKYALMQFIGKTDLELQRFIKIDGVEYGFEPNLSNIAYGAYADITQYQTLTIDDNWPKIMSILYRPITKRVRDTYDIETYKGEINEDKFLGVSMDVHFGALFFFVRLSTDLLKSILNYMKEEELPHNIKSILERSGEIIQQSWN